VRPISGPEGLATAVVGIDQLDGGEISRTHTFELASERGRAEVRLDLFDSEVFERSIWRLTNFVAETPAGYAALLELVIGAVSTDAAQLLCRTSAAHLPEVWALEAMGFQLVDAGVTFALRSSAQVATPADSAITVRAATDDDLAALVPTMVELPWGGRLDADPTYTVAQVREHRSRWLWNSHRGRANAFLVGVLDGVPAGYVTCVLDPNAATGDIELVGTLPAFRRLGVASCLVAHAVAWFASRVGTVSVRTQSTNAAAARVYEKAGFTLQASDLTFRLPLCERPH